MRVDIFEQSDKQPSSDAEARKRERRKQALGANPDVPSPESGETGEDEDTDSGGP